MWCQCHCFVRFSVKTAKAVKIKCMCHLTFPKWHFLMIILNFVQGFSRIFKRYGLHGMRWAVWGDGGGCCDMSWNGKYRALMIPVTTDCGCSLPSASDIGHVRLPFTFICTVIAAEIKSQPIFTHPEAFDLHYLYWLAYSPFLYLFLLQPLLK